MYMEWYTYNVHEVVHWVSPTQQETTDVVNAIYNTHREIQAPQFYQQIQAPQFYQQIQAPQFYQQIQAPQFYHQIQALQFYQQ